MGPRASTWPTCFPGQGQWCGFSERRSASLAKHQPQRRATDKCLMLRWATPISYIREGPTPWIGPIMEEWHPEQQYGPTELFPWDAQAASQHQAPLGLTHVCEHTGFISIDFINVLA